MDNREVLNEAFFGRKKSELEKFKARLPQYAPVDPNRSKTGATSYEDALKLDGAGFAIKDTNEIKKRLAGTFGAAFGNNTVKSLASRSVKKFPIVVSNAIDPSAVVMFKKLLEEQVAEYINLLISNEVIDLSSFQTSSEEGNVALQALDQLTNATYSRQDVANKASKGKFDGSDFFQGAPFLYSLIRNESKIESGNPLLDMLLENAVVLAKEDAEAYSNELERTLTEAAGAENLKEMVLLEWEKDYAYSDHQIYFGQLGISSNRLFIFEGKNDLKIGKLTVPKGYLMFGGKTAENGIEDAVRRRFFCVSESSYRGLEKVTKPALEAANFETAGTSFIKVPDDVVLAEKKKCANSTGIIEAEETIVLGFPVDSYDKYRNIIREITSKAARSLVVGGELSSGVAYGPVIKFMNSQEMNHKYENGIILVMFQPSDKFGPEFRGMKDPFYLDIENYDIVGSNGRVARLNSSISPSSTASAVNGPSKDEGFLTVSDVLSGKYDNEAKRFKAYKNLGFDSGETLSTALKDRYSKALVLLQTNKISGQEFIDYCQIRLGFPIPKETAAVIRREYPWNKIVKNPGSRAKGGKYKDSGILFSDKEIQYLNSKTFKVDSTNLIKDTLFSKQTGLHFGSLVLVGGGTGAGLAAAIPGGLAATAGLGVGATAGLGLFLVFLLIKAIKRKKFVDFGEGWERVEALIEKLDRQIADVERGYNRSIGKEDYAKSASFKNFQTGLNMQTELKYHNYLDNDTEHDYNNPETRAKVEEAMKAAKEATEAARKIVEEKTEEAQELQKKLESAEERLNSRSSSKNLGLGGIFRKLGNAFAESDDIVDDSYGLLSEEVEEFESMAFENLAEAGLISTEDEVLIETAEIRAERLAEAVISLDTPTTLRDKKKGLDIDVKKIVYDPSSEIIVPNFTKSGAYAYGSVEYDKKENRDRRFNTPLILKVNFKSKFSDGRSQDSELTAVIGILGVVTTVPSEEMKYILKSNAENKTISGILRADGSQKGTIGDIFSGAKLKKDLENLPQSSEIWRNLENVAKIAIANKLTGKSNNNVSNAHLIFAQKEIDELRGEDGIDYIRDKKLSAQLLKRYSAFSIMIANDAAERVYIFDDIDNISWNVVPYSALQSKESGDQMLSALSRLERGRI